MDILTQQLKVQRLHEAWDCAAKRYNHYQTWYDLAKMQDAQRALQAAEDELMALVEDERYDPTIAKNVRVFDLDAAEQFELAHPGALM